MNPDTMTLAEMADWCARDEDYTQYADTKKWRHNITGMPMEHHPFPLTLDGAAKAMPEGWGYWINHHWLHGKANVFCEAVYINGMPCPLARVSTEADNEILARYRLGVKARLAAKGVQA
jgi:hypothetical protein